MPGRHFQPSLMLRVRPKSTRVKHLAGGQLWGRNLALPTNIRPGNTKGGSITVLLTSCLTGLKSAV